MLCSNHGKYGGGLCHCEEGWKGTECDIPETDCRAADCFGHGVCKNGVCQCQQGWKGDDCNEGTVIFFICYLMIKIYFRFQWTVWIKAVLATVSVYQVSVTAKLDGKAKIVH